MTTKEKNVSSTSTYAKVKDVIDATDKRLEEDEEVRVSRKLEKSTRPARKRVYEKVVETDIPQHVINAFAEDDYELRWIRFTIGGEVDIRNLSKREREGYEFVKPSELPQDFLAALKVQDTKERTGLVTSGDVVLVKVDTELRKSRADYYKNRTDEEYQAADIYNVASKKGFIATGSKSSVSHNKEPKFQ